MTLEAFLQKYSAPYNKIIDFCPANVIKAIIEFTEKFVVHDSHGIAIDLYRIETGRVLWILRWHFDDLQHEIMFTEEGKVYDTHKFVGCIIMGYGFDNVAELKDCYETEGEK